MILQLLPLNIVMGRWGIFLSAGSTLLKSIDSFLLVQKGMIHFEDAGNKKPLIFYDKSVDLNSDIPRSKLGEKKNSLWQ